MDSYGLKIWEDNDVRIGKDIFKQLRESAQEEWEEEQREKMQAQEQLRIQEESRMQGIERGLEEYCHLYGNVVTSNGTTVGT